MDSILTSIKKLLGIAKEYTVYDQDIIIHINSTFVRLHELNVGPKELFRIEDDIAVWYDFIKDDKTVDAVKTYMYLKVRLVFDPPLNSAVLETIKQEINKWEWLLNVEAESK